MSHIWLHHPDCKAKNEKWKQQGSMLKSMPAAQQLIPAKYRAATCSEVLWGVSIEYCMHASVKAVKLASIVLLAPVTPLLS